jgi:hypothetical protein
MPDEPNNDFRQPPRTRLNSWKEIATYLEKDLSPRTAQWWETEGLPVYREGVRFFAYADELERWRSTRIVGPRVRETIDPVEPPERITARQEARKF